MLVPRFQVGTKFLSRGKYPRECTVVDILTTTNLAGEIVMIKYVATHAFGGQVLTDRDVCDATVARGQIPLRDTKG